MTFSNARLENSQSQRSLPTDRHEIIAFKMKCLILILFVFGGKFYLCSMMFAVDDILRKKKSNNSALDLSLSFAFFFVESLFGDG